MSVTIQNQVLRTWLYYTLYFDFMSYPSFALANRSTGWSQCPHVQWRAVGVPALEEREGRNRPSACGSPQKLPGPVEESLGHGQTRAYVSCRGRPSPVACFLRASCTLWLTHLSRFGLGPNFFCLCLLRCFSFCMFNCCLNDKFHFFCEVFVLLFCVCVPFQLYSNRKEFYHSKRIQ